MGKIVGSEKDMTGRSEPRESGNRDLLLARARLAPAMRHASTASAYASHLFGDSHEPSIATDVDVLKEMMASAEKGDKNFASQILAAQAVSLDTMFTELALRARVNMGEYIDAADRYMKLALKAQSNCRATLEALSKLHQPREQIVKHVHVNEGGQAVVAEQINQYQGEGRNEKSNEQSHATETAGENPAMLSEDAQGNGVPIASRERAEAVPNARRDQPGSAQR